MNFPLICSGRRTFLMQVATGGSVLIATGALAQAAGPKVDEKDPAAAALGYAADTSKVDQKNFPSMPPTRSAPIAISLSAKRLTPPVLARCSLASRWPVRVGAAPGSRKPAKAGFRIPVNGSASQGSLHFGGPMAWRVPLCAGSSGREDPASGRAGGGRRTV